MPRSLDRLVPRTFIALLLLLLATVRVTGLAAQADASEWATPANLSQSGAASDVVVTRDSEGTTHVLWQDANAGFVYTRSEAEGWSAPVAVELPFVAELTEQESSAGDEPELYTPQLLADRNGRVHGFWLDEDATLLHSAVAAGAFTTAESWGEPATLAEGVLTMVSAVDTAGSLHLAYIKSQDEDEATAGIYYQRSDDGGANWTEAAGLMHSAYFRSLPVEQANIDIATAQVAEAGRVLVAWDMPAREKVFVRQSNDNGATWLEAREVDARRAEDAELAQGPVKIGVTVTGSEIHLVWQAGHDGALCNQYHQWSPDGGDTWRAPEIIFDELLVCPAVVKPLVGGDGQMLAAVTVEGNVQGGGYLAAWNGDAWSALREQAPLTRFINPETLRPVTLSCREDLVAAGQLMVIGCSSGEPQDVWLLTRPVGEMRGWFPAASGWAVEPVVAGAAHEIRFTTAIADRDSRIHVFWTETDSAVINYVHWDGQRWSQSLPVLRSPSGAVNRPVVLLTEDRRLLASWYDEGSGKIYYSQTGADDAPFAEEWIEPQELPLGRAGVTSADMAVEGASRIYAAFTIPINEGRGVYLIRSDDLGETWTEPSVVFDAIAGEWAMIGQPQLAVGSGGDLHLLWTRYAPPPSVQPQALVYARSVDGGATWTAPQVVTENEPLWSQITNAGETGVHRHWQEAANSRAIIRQESTRDSGLSWSFTSLAADASDAGPVALIADAAGQLHLIYREGIRLDYRMWNGQRWSQAESLQLRRTDVSELTTLAATVTSDGELAIVFGGRAVEKEASPGSDQMTSQAASEASNTPEHVVQLAKQALGLPFQAEATSAETEIGVAEVAPADQPEPAVAAAEESAPAPQATAAAPAGGGGARDSSLTSRLAGLSLQTIVVLALLPAGLLVLLVLGLSLYRTRKVG
jgi:hypothetical protein